MRETLEENGWELIVIPTLEYTSVYSNSERQHGIRFSVKPIYSNYVNNFIAKIDNLKPNSGEGKKG